MFKRFIDLLLFIDRSERNVYIRTIELGLKYPNGFSYGEIINNSELGLREWEKDVIVEYLKNAYENFTFGDIPQGNADRETLFLMIKEAKGGGKGDFTDDSHRYTINLDAYFKFIDYEEIRLARKAARDAKILSWMAIIIAILIPFFAARYINQTVNIDHSQFEELKTMLEKK